MILKILSRTAKQLRQSPSDAPAFVQAKASATAPSYLAPLTETVEESWEAPDAAQYQHSFDDYLHELLAPIAELEDALEQQRLQFHLKVERMMEIAPDLFEKALRKSGLETGYLIKEPRDAE